MRLAFEQNPDRVSAEIARGGGSAPEFRFEGTTSPAATSDVAGQLGFREYDAYARWLIDQHLSLAIWPRETIVQDPTRPVDCFAVEGPRVFLDEVAIFRS